MNTERARAKALILKWFDSGAPEPRVRRLLSTGIDCFFDEITRRSTWAEWECISTKLGDENTPPIRVSGANWRVRPCRAGLAASSVVPDWGYGWSHILPDDENVYLMLSWLGFLARQYIHRSNIAKVLMIGWEQYGVVLHPFGSGKLSARYLEETAGVTPRQALDRADGLIDETWGTANASTTPSRSIWRTRNTLDPAIHQGIFHFLRAQNLAKAKFELEALAALDCVLQSLQALDWSGAPGNPRHSRADLCRALDFGERTAALAEHVYFLRNQFIAHAGGWRWWDVEEYLDDGQLIDSASKLASRALRRAADLETRYRRIDPAPSDWGEWLLRHFAVLWDAIWFRDPRRAASGR